MSPHTANSLMSDLIAMAKAMEDLPKVQEELAKAHDDCDTALRSLQAREEAILRYKAELEEKNSRIAALEVARDDAELRFLEADDRTEKALAFVRMVQGNAESLVRAIEPVKPEPASQPIAHPIEASAEVASPLSSGEPQIESGSRSEGQSESPPISATMEAGNYPSALSSVTQSEGASSTSPPLPFANKLYHDHPTYMSLSEWIAGGGNEDSYNWRPTPVAHKNW